MKIVCISDTHNCQDEISHIPDGDVLVHAGDMTDFGTKKSLIKFAKWMRMKPHKNKIVICGNHEKEVSENTQAVKDIFEPKGITVLHEETIEIGGVKFWGQPRTPEFCNWGWAYERGQEAEEVWAKMPWDTDVLICHGPPHGIADKVYRNSFGVFPSAPRIEYIGCVHQRRRVEAVKPKFVICGHAHGNYGIHKTDFGTVVINASMCDGYNNLMRKPIVVEI